MTGIPTSDKQMLYRTSTQNLEHLAKIRSLDKTKSAVLQACRSKRNIDLLKDNAIKTACDSRIIEIRRENALDSDKNSSFYEMISNKRVQVIDMLERNKYNSINDASRSTGESISNINRDLTRSKPVRWIKQKDNSYEITEAEYSIIDSIIPNNKGKTTKQSIMFVPTGEVFDQISIASRSKNVPLQTLRRYLKNGNSDWKKL